MATRKALIRDFALSLPGAREEFPWGESVAKAGSKVFVFLGRQEAVSHPAITIKLAESHAHALAIDGAGPTGYGLGPAGWVTVPIRAQGVTIALLRDLVEESYRIVAPRRLVAELDVRSARKGGGEVRAHGRGRARDDA
jgi:predicted DNA-binding protein (MmcQ/YjbR family)